MPEAMPFVLAAVGAVNVELGVLTVHTLMDSLKVESGHPCLCLLVQGRNAFFSTMCACMRKRINRVGWMVSATTARVFARVVGLVEERNRYRGCPAP